MSESEILKAVETAIGNEFGYAVEGDAAAIARTAVEAQLAYFEETGEQAIADAIRFGISEIAWFHPETREIDFGTAEPPEIPLYRIHKDDPKP